ncbi:MAG: glycoside hydrolase family 43 protein [Verrucomicrobiota bacterium]
MIGALIRTIGTAALISGTALFAAETFKNPINPSADPWMGHADGEYHLATTQGNCVRLWSAKSIKGLKTAKPVMIWQRGIGVWAAEFHRLKGKDGMRWYCYFTKTPGEDVKHRMFVMESKTDSIKGPYGEPKQLMTDPKDEFYAIDGHVFEQDGKLYFLWAGHPGHLLYISRMKDPMTLTGEWVNIPASGFGCPEVREGPYVIKHGDRLFLTYSACDTGKPDYKVGYLWADVKSDPMKVESWKQQDRPLLERADANKVFGPGHHGFFKSPDGKEDWIVYHGKTSGGYTYRGRSTRAQKLVWSAGGFPEKVVLLALDAEIPLPSGDPG